MKKLTQRTLWLGGRGNPTKPQGGEGSPLAAAVTNGWSLPSLQASRLPASSKLQISKSAWMLILITIGLAVSACDNGGTTSAHTHTAGAAATCVTPQTCTSCGEVMQGATGHDFEHDDWDEDEIDASCEHPSYDTIACKNAPCTIKDKRTGSHPALGHDLPGAYAATCMAKGSTGTGHCYRCDEDKTGVPLNVDPENHDFSGTPVITPATCTTDGKEVINCGNNGCTETHGTVLEALKHEGTIQPFAATCTTAGNSALSGNCVRYAQCGYVVTGTVTNALGHDHGTSGTGSLICKRDHCDHQYAIGDTGPAGGIIFYVVDDGLTVQGYGSFGDNGYFAEYTAYYLEAAPANEPNSRWQAASDNTLIDGITIWLNATAKNAGLAGSIGVGRKDTQTIVNSAAFAALTDTAAQRCASKDTGGKTDWFLPSLGELNEFYKLKGQVGVPQTGIPTTGWFWSSAQASNISAWLQSFDNGNQLSNLKDYSGNVRAVRAF